MKNILLNSDTSHLDLDHQSDFLFSHIRLYLIKYLLQLERTSDGGNGNHSVSLPTILIKIKVNKMLPSSSISSLLVYIL